MFAFVRGKPTGRQGALAKLSLFQFTFIVEDILQQARSLLYPLIHSTEFFVVAKMNFKHLCFPGKYIHKTNVFLKYCCHSNINQTHAVSEFSKGITILVLFIMSKHVIICDKLLLNDFGAKFRR